MLLGTGAVGGLALYIFIGNVNEDFLLFVPIKDRWACRDLNPGVHLRRVLCCLIPTESRLHYRPWGTDICALIIGPMSLKMSWGSMSFEHWTSFSKRPNLLTLTTWLELPVL